MVQTKDIFCPIQTHDPHLGIATSVANQKSWRKLLHLCPGINTNNLFAITIVDAFFSSILMPDLRQLCYLM